MPDPTFAITRIVIDGRTRQITAECAMEHPDHSSNHASITLPHTDGLAACQEYVLKHVAQMLCEVIRFEARIPNVPEGHDEESS